MPSPSCSSINVQNTCRPCIFVYLYPCLTLTAVTNVSVLNLTLSVAPIAHITANYFLQPPALCQHASFNQTVILHTQLWAAPNQNIFSPSRHCVLEKGWNLFTCWQALFCLLLSVVCLSSFGTDSEMCSVRSESYAAFLSYFSLYRTPVLAETGPQLVLSHWLSFTPKAQRWRIGC